MFDFIIVGGGIVGLSTAYSLIRAFPSKKVMVIEKEAAWASHQTGHNSGVIHSGIYYKPGSLKARLAREGHKAMVAFCEKHEIAFDLCGKVIVAAQERELPVLDRLYQQGLDNQLQISKITPEELSEIEPHVQGLAAIRVPHAGIVNYKQVAGKMVQLLGDAGVELRLNTEALKLQEREKTIVLETSQGEFQTKYLINCAGLQSDRVAKLDNVRTGMKIIPFRGEYYQLKAERRHLVKNLIYPVPNPEFPFLGVHFTRMIGGHVDVGPNAVLSLKREGYQKTDFNLRDTLDTLAYPAFWKLASKYWKQGMQEIVQSFNKKVFVRNAQCLIPEIEERDLVPAEAGVRAQALKDNGSLVDDFYIQSTQNSIHVCNAPSPAATASLVIGEYIVNETIQRFGLEPENKVHLMAVK